MSTHDVLAYAVATEAVARLRAAAAPWNSIFSPSVYITASRTWPVPDFVLVDSTNCLNIAAEFKPPQQTKREYLTGLGQAISYSRDFHYSLLVVPDVADDGYRIADHIDSVLKQASLRAAPIGLLSYDPKVFSPFNPGFNETHFFAARTAPPQHLASLDQSFYAKWREMSPAEVFLFLSFSYDEMRSPVHGAHSIRDQAFEKLWTRIQAGAVLNWAMKPRTASATTKEGVKKNYRNFLFHIGWTEAGGALTKEGIEAHHIGTLYGPWSRPFLDAIAFATLTGGKHLILFNAIAEYQDNIRSTFPAEGKWLDGLEVFLEAKGLLKRNPQRAAAATQGEARGFLKAEKQLWKQLELVIPRGRYVFHPNRGFIFNWSRITDLLQNAPSF